MVLVDTSIWVNFLNNYEPKQSNILESLIEKNEVTITYTIYQEILQGIKNDNHFEQLKYYLLGFPILKYDLIEAAIGSANIYRQGKKKGITIRKSNDCLIAWYAIKARIPIFAIDRDFKLISQYTSLKLYG